MFGRKKSIKLIEDIDRYFDIMDQSLLVYKEGVRNYLYSNPEGFNDNLKKMSALESEGDVLRREIENALYTQTALVRSRGDIMRLFEKTRSITNLLNDSLPIFAEIFFLSLSVRRSLTLKWRNPSFRFLTLDILITTKTKFISLTKKWMAAPI